MLKWLTPVIGLISLALGTVVFIKGKDSQEIIGIVIMAVSAIVILVGIGLLLEKKRVKTQKTPAAATEKEEEPPAF